MIHVILIGDALIGNENQSAWKGFRVVAEMPFSNGGGDVTCGSEVIRKSVFIRVYPFLISMED
jgi:hypothetical protein